MTDFQANEIIDNTIKSHWPNWSFAGQELVVWIEELRKYDYETVRQAINELYKSWEKDRYPKMAHILGAIRRYVARKYKGGSKKSLFGIFRQDGTPRFRDFWGNANMPKQEVERIAKKICENTNAIYGGKHYYQIYADIPF